MSYRALSYLGVFVLAALYGLPIAGAGLNLYDEGLRLYGAERILAGSIPYRDFFAYYGPAQFYWPALLFGLFGTQVIVARLGSLLFVALGGVALFALCRNAGLRASWSLVPVAALLVPMYRGDLLYLCDPALSLILAAGALVTSTVPSGVGRSSLLGCLAAGILIGFAALFRQDFGAYGAVALVLTVVWTIASPSGLHDPRVTDAGRPLACLLLGLLSVVVTSYGLLSWDVRGLFELLVLFPASALAYRDLPYSYELGPLYRRLLGARAWSLPLLWAAVRAGVMLTPFVGLAAVLSLAWPPLRRDVLTNQRRGAVLLFIVVAAAGALNYALGRSDFFHVYPLHVLGVTAATLVVVPALERAVGLRATRAMDRGLSLLVAVVVLAMAAAQWIATREYVPLLLPRAAGIVVSPHQAWLSQAVADIHANGPESSILVASERHDRVYINAVMVYFLAARTGPTYFHDFIPGLTTTRAVQERIVADLERAGVRTVMVWKVPLPDEPNLSRTSSQVSILDDFLRTEFATVRETEHYRILGRRR